jgi:hypothetical protein
LVATLGSAQAVEAEGAAGEHLVLRRGGQLPEPLAEDLRRAREEAVRVRIVGGPHDLVRPDIVGQHRDAALHRLERDPAIALEQLARRGLVEALVIEVPVHAVEPRRDPPAARLEKRDPQSRMAVDDPASDHAERDQHHLHRVRDHVARRAILLEAVDADGPVDDHSLGAVARSERRLGDDHRDGLADEANAIDGQRKGLCDVEGRAVGPLERHFGGFVGTGRCDIALSPSATRSAPVNTASTPGLASAAAVSMRAMHACACGERTIDAYA